MTAASRAADAASTPRPDSLRGKVFRASIVLGARRLTRGQLRSSAWRRLFPDVYACASLPVDHRLRAGAVRLLLPDAVLSGRSAGVLWGVDLAARLPRPVAQYEVRDARGFVARVDFAWPEARVAVEYDGGGTGSRGTWRRTAAGSTG